VIGTLRRLDVPLTTPDSQALFKVALFVFTLLMARRVLAAIAAVPTRAPTRREKLWGLVLGLLHGFLIVATVERYLTTVIQATAGSAGAVVRVRNGHAVGRQASPGGR